MSTHDMATGLEIAVCGMAGAFPGAPSVQQLWALLLDGREGLSRFEPEVLIAKGGLPDLVRQSNFVPVHGVIDGYDQFDHARYGYSVREAAIMDPQQRLFLELASEALNAAGEGQRARGALTGVFAGASANGYLEANVATGLDLDVAGRFQASYSNHGDFLATRVAYKLNLKGPALTVQTACSTSLMAVQLACQHLLAGACDVALAGGVSISMPTEWGYLYQEGMIRSPDGHCRAFDHRAQGTLKGDGGGVVVLKRLEDALADGNPIHAVVLAAATNNDGSAKVGYTAPGFDGQVRVLEEALALADLDPRSVGMIEAHGTGTPMGDPIEISALAAAYGARDEQGFIGSVKSNIGHLDAAAGIAGFIKACLSVRERIIPPTLHVERPNPEIDFAASPFVPATQRQRFAEGHKARAGISSFGIGGTNAHVLVEEPPLRGDGASSSSRVLWLSARTDKGTEIACAALGEALEAQPRAALDAVARTLAKGHEHLDKEVAILARDRDDAIRQLKGGVGVAPLRRATAGGPVVFAFPGQGAQHPGMGRTLAESDPDFRRVFTACVERFAARHGIEVEGFITAPDERSADALKETVNAQAAVFAIEMAVAAMWQGRGIRPDIVVGHSLGELAAAAFAGVFDLETGVDLVAARAKAMQAMPRGAMLSVAISERDAAVHLGCGVELAAINGPRQTVLSGPEDAIAALERRLQAEDGPRATRLETSHAFHSESMQAAAEQFRAIVAAAQLRPASVRFASAVDGAIVPAERVAEADYWYANVRQPVRFCDAVSAIEDAALFLECGPGTTLTSLVGRLDRPAPAFASLPHAKSAQDAGVVVARAENAVRICLAARGETEISAPMISLPGPPHERSRCWIDPKPRRQTSQRAGDRLMGHLYDAASILSPEWRTAGRADGPWRGQAAAFELHDIECGGLHRSASDAGFASSEADADFVILAAGSTSTAFHTVAMQFARLARRSPAPRQVVLLTRRAYDPLAEGWACPWANACAALLRGLAADLPQIGVRHVDLGAEEDIATAFADIVDGRDETVAIRRGLRFLPVPSELAAPSLAPFMPRRWVITGGQGRVGGAIAMRALKDPSVSVALIARSERAAAELFAGAAEAEAEGRLCQFTADVRDKAGLGLAFDEIAKRFGAIDLVVHAAGAAGEAARLALADLDGTKLDRIFGAKTEGAENITELTARMSVPHTVLMSSIATVLPSAQAAVYAAANAWLDAHAVQCDGEGRRVQSLAWDTWAEEVAPGSPPALSHEAGWEGLLAALRYPQSTLFLAAGGLGSMVSTDDTHAAKAEQGGSLADTLRSAWEDLLGQRLGDDENFFSAGGDSVVALQTIERLRRAGFDLAISDIFRHQTISAISASVAGGAVAATVAAADEAPSLPQLSSAQRRLWFLESINPDNRAFVLLARLHLRGALDVARLERALGTLIDRHDALRTIVEVSDEGVPSAALGEAAPFVLDRSDMRATSQVDREEAIRAQAEKIEARFNLGKGPHLHASLVQWADDESSLLLAVHHFAADDVSFAVLFEELDALYRDPGASLAPVPSYFRHAAREESFLSSARSGPARTYWKERLASAPPAINLRTDHPRPLPQSGRGAACCVAVDAEALGALDVLARRAGTSTYAAALTLFTILLSRITGDEDIVIGSPMSTRKTQDEARTVGPFINSLPIRVGIEPGQSLAWHLSQVSGHVGDAQAHLGLPFEDIVGLLDVPRDLSRSPVFQVMFTYLNAASPDAKLGDVSVTIEPRRGGGAEVDLHLTLRTGQNAEGAEAFIEYAADLFDQATIARIGSLFISLLKASPEHYETAVAALGFGDQTDAKRLLAEGEGPVMALPAASNLAELILAKCAEHPGKTAVSGQGNALTYAELARKTRSIAATLRAEGAADVPVGILCDRSPALLPAMLGVMAAGAPYLPLDPEYPDERLRQMIGDSGARLIITDDPLAVAELGEAKPLLLHDLMQAAPLTASEWPPAAPSDLAYVIYTSGSTGTPKGVSITHENVVNFLLGSAEALPLSVDDVLGAVTTVCFDIHVLELFLPLVVGGEVHVVPRGDARDGRRLMKRMEAESITALQATPVTWQMLLDEGWVGGGGFTALCGGEGWPQGLAEALGSKVGRLFNMYGPTETTVWSSITPIGLGDAVTVGRPMANQSFHVVDPHLRPLPAGIRGELMIGGKGVAKGYYKRPDLTSERFVEDPFGPGSGRFYLTGDAAVRMGDGRVDLLGRIDHQLKLRGFRIEAGEVEAKLKQLAGVKEALVVVRDDLPDGSHLIAYLLSDGSPRPATPALMNSLRDSLPTFMVPTRMVWVEDYPRTWNGKIDRKRLPLPDTPTQATPTMGASVAATPTEALVADAFSKALGGMTVTQDDRFFDLGGQSILALKVVALIEKSAGQRIDVGQLFQQNVRQIAAGLLPSAADTPSDTRADEPKKGFGSVLSGLFGSRGDQR